MRNRIRRHQANNSQSTLLPTILISTVIVMLWGYLFPPPPAVTSNQSNQNQQVIEQNQSKPSDPIFDQLNVKAVIDQANSSIKPAKELHHFLLPSHQKLSINSHGQLDTVVLLEKQYQRKKIDPNTQKELRVDELLVQSEGHDTLGEFVNPLLDIYVNGMKVEGTYQLQSTSDKQVTLSLLHPLVEVTRVFEPHDEYQITEKLSIRNLSNMNAQIKIVGLVRGLQNLNQKESSMFSPALNMLNALCDQNGELERESYTSIQDLIQDQDPTLFSNQVRWIGIENQYFMTALSSKNNWKSCQLQVGYASAKLNTSKSTHDALSVAAVLFEDFIAPNQPINQEVRFFVGPKRLEALKANDPSLTDAINFGVFSPLCYPMLWFMRIAYDLIPNWGIAIILLTLLVKLLTYPINAKQYDSMNKMKALQPEMEKIKEKYQEKDPLKLQEETMALYKKHNVNPAAGCLPLFLMMPIYMALYSTVGQAVELYQAPFFGWIQDLSASDPYFILPILLVTVMFVQARLQPTTVSDPTQKFMFTYFMPGFFGFMMLFLPSALVLYILVNTILGIVQQKMMGSSTPTPTPNLLKKA